MEKAKNLDEFIKSLEGKSPREVNKKIRDSIPKNMLLMLNILPEIKKKNEGLKKDFPEVNKLIKELRIFFEELEKDGIIKIERSLFESPIKEAQKEGDERDSGIKSFSRVKREKLPYPEAFKELNNFYHGAYCFITKGSLRKIAERLVGRKLESEGDIIQELKKFKNKKHKNLFEVLVPQIKNSISHKTAYIDRKEPLINYEDRNKPNLKLTLKEFSNICDRLLFLQLALDILKWEFFMEFYMDVANKLKTVNQFVQKYEGEIKWTGNKRDSLSLYNLGKFLQERKDKGD